MNFIVSGLVRERIFNPAPTIPQVRDMERSHAFETALVLILIGLICLLFLMIVSTPQQTKGWEMQGYDSVGYIFTGSDDTLYVFQGNNVKAIKNDGRIAWSLKMPDKWYLFNRLKITGNPAPEGYMMHYEAFCPIMDEASGYLYLYLTKSIEGNEFVFNESDPFNFYADVSSKIVAISPHGTVAWEYPFLSRVVAWSNNGIISGDFEVDGNVALRAHDGRLFVFHDYREDVLDANGKLLFTLNNVSSQAAVDEKDNIYTVRAEKPDIKVNSSVPLPYWADIQWLLNDSRLYGEDDTRLGRDSSYMIKTSIIDAYNREGILIWSKDIGEKITGTYDETDYYKPTFRSLPQYFNGTLYVPVRNGTAAVGADGTVKWIRHLADSTFVPFELLPVDASGNVYMMTVQHPTGYTYVCTLAPDGTVNKDAWRYDRDVSITGSATGAVARKDGTVFLLTNNSLFPVELFNQQESSGQAWVNTLTAFDIMNNKALWNFAVPYDDLHQLILNKSNIDEALLLGSDFDRKLNEVPGRFAGWPAEEIGLLPMQNHRITINPGKNVIYMSYFSIIYEYPIVFNRSRCVYVNSLYALDNNGSLIWKKPMDELVSHAVARNDTFYYSTHGGRIGGNTVNVAAGIALAAAAYVVFRFFILGTVARARTKIESNRNRNDLLKFINENPGVTAVDISRGLKMNLGTSRYHLFILTANHKIVSYKDDGKFLRYFRNSGAYSPEERSWLSLMRREPIRKVIAALERNPGQSLQELARELDMSQTAVHNHISELAARGIVDRAQGSDRGYAYVIKEEYRPLVARTMQRL